MGGIRVIKEYKNQPTISQKIDGGHIGEDGLLVLSGPGHPLLFVHRTVFQEPNESAVVEFWDSAKDDLSDHDKPSLMVKCNKNLSFTMGLVSRRVRRDSPITGRDIGSRGRHQIPIKVARKQKERVKYHRKEATSKARQR